MQFLRAPKDASVQLILDTDGESINGWSTIDESSEHTSKGQIKANTPGNEIGPITAQPTNFTSADSKPLARIAECLHFHA